MKLKISKMLEAVVARAAFNTTKAGITRSLKDVLLLELLDEEGTLAYQLLSSRLKDWELQQARQGIERAVADAPHGGEFPESFYPNFLEELGGTTAPIHPLSTGDALCAILRDPGTVASRVLEMYGVTAESIAEDLGRFSDDDAQRAEWGVRRLRLDAGTAEPARASGLLDKFGVDLTAQAREGRIDPVIGRDAEIERVVQILSRRKKNNPVLIGEAGVGKSAIVEGLALRMARGEVPATISRKRLFSLDLSSLVAGTKFRGEFEERLQQLLEELRRAQDTILFIDEIHTIVGAGATQGSLDTANMLKPALARGEVQTIGATTLDEYRENIECDAALERRFQRVVVEPTTEAQTLHILRQLAPRYEAHHAAHYTEEALAECVALAARYITDRHFPDKAIDLMDEAGARAHLRAAQPAETVRRLEEELAATHREAAEALAVPRYEAAAAARTREMALRVRLEETRAEWQRAVASRPVEVSADDIREVVTGLTGVPAARISDDESGRLRQLHDHLARQVIGQSEAVERIARAIRRSRAGLKEENRPIGVFLFVGPTGVGKTLLAKELSRWMFDERRGLIRLDMSEYAEKHNVARLIGSPPGYVGYGEGGQLTEAVRRQPYAVVLFDEIEKAHPEVFNALLQLFDEGHLTDGAGRRVDFRNTILIMTSNLGSREAARSQSRVGYATTSRASDAATAPREEYRKALERHFAPEFLNRIDDILLFRMLEPADVERIVDLELKGLLGRTERLGYRVRITPSARRRLAKMGYEERYGVRSLRRTLQEQVEEPLSSLVIDGALRVGDTVVVEAARPHGIRLRVA